MLGEQYWAVSLSGLKKLKCDKEYECERIMYKEVIAMKKVMQIVLILTCMLGLIGCTISGSETDSESSYGSVSVIDETDSQSNFESVSGTDYPAAIMVDGEVYVMEGEAMSGEVADSAIMGYTTSYTDTFPQKDGETNFNRELEMPYAKVKDGVAVLYENEWHLCTPKE